MHGAFAHCRLLVPACHNDGVFRAACCLELAGSGYCPDLRCLPRHFRAGNRTEIGNVLVCLGRW